MGDFREARTAVIITIIAAGATGPATAEEPMFQVVEGAFPGATYWTEGLGFGDVDHDGDLDIFFARGEGWTGPGRVHQNALFINKLEEQPFTFADESVERLGYSESHARDVITADADGDGWIDALFVNAFNRAPPYLFINRGDEKPGHFKNESDVRGLTEALGASSASFGDVDDDGDLDLVIADLGPNGLFGPGGRTRLYMNAGDGRFREEPDRIGAPLQIGAMGAHLVDIDGDFDLDLFGPNRTGRTDRGHTLLLNEAGYFKDASFLLPKTTGSTYEADAADLDGDGDVDFMFTGLAETTDDASVRFRTGEGPVANRLAETGELSFEAGNAIGIDDDNDVVFHDYDHDGDLDAFIASLGPKEKVLRNDGDLNFAFAEGVVAVVEDATLDMGFADLDNDGAPELVTATGYERIGAEQPPCLVYRNTGTPDARAPSVIAVKPLADPAWTGAPLLVHARVQDDTVSEHDTWVTGAIEVLIDPPDGALDFASASRGRATESGPGLWRFEVDPANAGRIAYRLVFRDRAGNETVTEPTRTTLTEERPQRRRRRGG